MSLREFLHEEKQVRKQMRAERKQNKKHPKTKKEKFYKAVSIIFTISVICGAILYTCNNLSGGYDWSNITGINEEIVEMLERDVNTSLITGDFAITKDYENSLNEKLLKVDIDYSQIEESSKMSLSGTLNLNSGETGAFARDILEGINSDKSYELVAFKIYSDTTYVYEISVMKVYLSKYISNANLPDIYISTTSMCEIQNEKITALNYDYTINNLSEEDSKKVMDVLNKNIIITDLGKLPVYDVNVAINIINSIFESTLRIASDRVSFIKK